MHYARRGEITDAMRFVADREEISPELMRDEIAMKWMYLYWSGTVAAIIGMGYFGPK